MLKTEIDQFLTEKRVGIVGISRSKEKFGNKVYQKLKESGYDVYPVHPEMDSMDGDKCLRSLRELPGEVRALMVIAGQDVCAEVLKDTPGTNIKRIWLFPTKQSPPSVEAEIQRLKDDGVSVICGLCPFMFLEPVATFHSIHRFFARLLGNYPK